MKGLSREPDGVTLQVRFYEGGSGKPIRYSPNLHATFCGAWGAFGRPLYPASGPSGPTYPIPILAVGQQLKLLSPAFLNNVLERATHSGEYLSAR